ncbi:MAG: hypothetical protein JW837_07320 [Sedimentisphaerales bacterium]|nr:hypothetical protein [Sedimentisphaerales bacterium]
MKKGILLTVVICLCTAVFAQAQEGELSGTLDVTYRSAYTWYGIDRLVGAHGEGVTETTLDLDLYGTGLGMMVKWVLPNTGSVGNGSLVNAEELWYNINYSNSLFEYETYATNYTIGWTHYDFPDQPSSLTDIQEISASFSWPEICPAGVIPSYTVVRMWKSESGHPDSPTGARGTQANDIAGWLHIFGLNYDLAVEDLLPELPEQTLHLSAAVVYNDGAGDDHSYTPGLGHDWSHFVIGVSTDFDLGHNLTLTPGVYHQRVMEKSIRRLNQDADVTYATVGIKWAF